MPPTTEQLLEAKDNEIAYLREEIARLRAEMNEMERAHMPELNDCARGAAEQALLDRERQERW